MRSDMPTWFKNFIIKWAKAYHPRYTEANVQAGIAMPTKQNLPANVAALRYTLWAYVCISKITRTVAGLPMRFYSGELNDKTNEQTSGDIVDLIKRPNPEDTHRELWQDTTGFLLGTGNAYWALDQVSASSGRPVTGTTTLWTLPAHRMEIIPTKGDSTKRISHYIAKTETGDDVRYETNEVVHFKSWNLESQYHGMAPLTVAMPLMETDFNARKHNQNFFRHGASPGIHLSTDKNYDPDTEKRIIEQFRANQQGTENAHKLIITWANLKAEDLKKNPKDLDWINLIKLNREEIIALFGVPPAEVGLFEFANYANALAQKELYWQETIIPMLQLFETRLNEHVFPRWTDKEIWMEFDTSGVAVLQGDLLNKAKVNTTLVGGGIITPNEARAEYGRDPITDGTADELKEPSRIGIAPSTTERSFKRKGFDPKAELWWKQDIERRRLEGKFFDVMKSYFAGLKRRVIKSLSAYPDDAILTEESANLLYNELVEQEIVEKTTTPLYQSAMKDAGQSAIDEVKSSKSFRVKQDEPINIGIVFDEFDPEVQAWIEAKVARFVTQISDTTIGQIRDIIAEGNAEGWTIRQLAEELASIDRLLFSNSRALTIAQTEMGAAANAGAMEGYKQSGVVEKKEWITARDQFVRDSHFANEAQGPIGFGEVFPNGLQHPLESGAPAEEVVNCRCRVVGIVAGDTEE